MSEGRVVQLGTPQELFEKPVHTFVGYFIGSPGMNFLDVEIDGNKAVVNGEAISLGAHYKPVEGRMQIGIRPEFATLSNKGGLPFTLKRVEDVGRHRIVRGEVAGATFNMIADEGAEISDAQTRVIFDPAKISVYANDWRVNSVSSGAAL